MSDFKVIPVMDILNQKVVHAIRGDRQNYELINKKYKNLSNEPIKMVKFLTEKYNFSTLYIADLDLIQRNLDLSPNLGIFKKILENFSQINLIVDLGIKIKKDLNPYVELNFEKYILGLETLRNLNTLKKCLREYSSSQIILSLDLYKSSPITKISELKRRTIFESINLFQNLGVRNLIILDLYRVGSKTGGIPDMYKKIQSIFEGNVYVGGGIKNNDDIINYENEGFSGVLIGTSIYEGTIKPKDLKKYIINQ